MDWLNTQVCLTAQHHTRNRLHGRGHQGRQRCARVRACTQCLIHLSGIAYSCILWHTIGIFRHTMVYHVHTVTHYAILCQICRMSTNRDRVARHRARKRALRSTPKNSPKSSKTRKREERQRRRGMCAGFWFLALAPCIGTDPDCPCSAPLPLQCACKRAGLLQDRWGTCVEQHV